MCSSDLALPTETALAGDAGDISTNSSNNQTFEEVIAERLELSRRGLLMGTAATAALGFVGLGTSVLAKNAIAQAAAPATAPATAGSRPWTSSPNSPTATSPRASSPRRRPNQSLNVLS